MKKYWNWGCTGINKDLMRRINLLFCAKSHRPFVKYENHTINTSFLYLLWVILYRLHHSSNPDAISITLCFYFFSLYFNLLPESIPIPATHYLYLSAYVARATLVALGVVRSLYHFFFVTVCILLPVEMSRLPICGSLERFLHEEDTH